VLQNVRPKRNEETRGEVRDQTGKRDLLGELFSTLNKKTAQSLFSVSVDDVKVAVFALSPPEDHDRLSIRAEMLAEAGEADNDATFSGPIAERKLFGFQLNSRKDGQEKVFQT
jgi:hypothetical protein